MRFSQIALLTCVAGGVAGAQGRGVACRGQRVDSILIDAQAPTVTGVNRIPVIGRVIRETHVTTRPEIVRGYLLLRVGDQCDDLRVSESERILRAQPFLADADIEVRASRLGGVILDVRTIDEFSLVISGSLANESPTVRAAKGGSGNLSGLGIAATAAWRHRPVYDDRLDLRIADYQFAGRPNILSMMILRDQFGRDDRVELTLPFRTDVQRFAWRTMVGESRSRAPFAVRDSGRLVLGYSREYAEGGGIIRVGPPGQLSLFGLSLSNERHYPDTIAQVVTARGFLDDTAAAFAGRFSEHKAARINALMGIRGLRFMRVRGFDALRGSQDIPIGLQFGTLLGRSLNAFGAASNDVFAESDIYIGVGNRELTYQLQVRGEGRRPRGVRDWDNLVGSARLTRHSRVNADRTRILTVEWSGTSRVLIPHSLSLGLGEAGLRGFRDATDIGGRRAIFRLDEQFYNGSPFNYGDFGLSIFSDVGRLWKGDVPYGTTTPVYWSVGASLLLAVPVRSTKMWRLEFAVPVNRAPGTEAWEVRLSHRDVSTFFWREPADVSPARARAVPASIYSWP